MTGADLFRSEWPTLIQDLHAQSMSLTSSLISSYSEQNWPELITTAQLEAHAHLKLVGLVGSIDNDMSMTDLTIGAPTALQRICEAIDNINSTAYSHSRAFVLEVMGRDCGWLALMAGIA